jgi:hypothetical protein
MPDFSFVNTRSSDICGPNELCLGPLKRVTVSYDMTLANNIFWPLLSTPTKFYKNYVKIGHIRRA